MAVFALEGGRLVPAPNVELAQHGVVLQALAAIRERLIDLLGVPLFPVAWTRAEGEESLIALDPTGQIVSVEVLERLDSAALLASLARAGSHVDLSRSQLAELYGSGATAFPADWRRFLDTCEPHPARGPRLYLVVLSLEESVRPAIQALSGAGLAVSLASVHDGGSQVLVSFEEVRSTATAFGTLASWRAMRQLQSDATSPTGAKSPAEPSVHSSDASNKDELTEDSLDTISRPKESTQSDRVPPRRRRRHAWVETSVASVVEGKASENSPRASSTDAESVEETPVLPRRRARSHAVDSSSASASSVSLSTSAQVSAPSPKPRPEMTYTLPLRPAVPVPQPAREPDPAQPSVPVQPKATESPSSFGETRAFSVRPTPPRPLHSENATAHAKLSETVPSPESVPTPSSRPAAFASIAGYQGPSQFAQAAQARAAASRPLEARLWENSTPRPAEGGRPRRFISEAQASQASSHAVAKAAEDDSLSPAHRMLAIVRRHRAPFVIVWQQRRHGSVYQAEVTAWGTIVLADGAVYDDPSLAAQAVSGLSRVDGWNVWKVADGRSLGEL